LWRIVAHYAATMATSEGTYDLGALTKSERELRRALHATIKKVTEDIGERHNFNTAISSIMELVNAMYAVKDESSSFNGD